MRDREREGHIQGEGETERGDRYKRGRDTRKGKRIG